MKFISATTRVLSALKIFDPTGDLSITNLIMMILAVKLAQAKSFGWDLVVITFLGLSAYSFKRYLNFKRRDLASAEQAAAEQARLASIETKLRLIESDLTVKEMFG